MRVIRGFKRQIYNRFDLRIVPNIRRNRAQVLHHLLARVGIGLQGNCFEGALKCLCAGCGGKRFDKVAPDRAARRAKVPDQADAPPLPGAAFPGHAVAKCRLGERRLH